MLTVDRLSFGYQHVPLFANVSFAVAAGQILHLTGPNGAGKSTLMSILAGLRQQTTGTISYRSPEGTEAEDRRDFVEYLPAEANGLYGRMDAVDNLVFWSRLRHKTLSREKIYTLLDEWGIGHPLVRENFPVGKFSTGMKRRLALCRIEASGSPCWLLDEPIYGLDAKGIALFQKLLSRHAAGGGMALIISHDLSPIDAIVTGHLALQGARKS